MVTLKIKVTKDILEEAKYCGVGSNQDTIYKNCAVAIAVRTIFPKACVSYYAIHPFGYLEIIGVSERKNPNNIYIDKTVSEYIQSFDSKRRNIDERLDMPELEFEVVIPDCVIEKINIDEIKPLLINHPTLELITQ